MAGSFNHCIDDQGNYRGHHLLENMGDMIEGVEEMMFMLLWIKHRADDAVSTQFSNGSALLQTASDEYFKCLRGEQPWPDFMKPGIG